jgi:hypothetical protein
MCQSCCFPSIFLKYCFHNINVRIKKSLIGKILCNFLFVWSKTTILDINALPNLDLNFNAQVESKCLMDITIFL